MVNTKRRLSEFGGASNGGGIEGALRSALDSLDEGGTLVFDALRYDGNVGASFSYAIFSPIIVSKSVLIVGESPNLRLINKTNGAAIIVQPNQDQFFFGLENISFASGAIGLDITGTYKLSPNSRVYNVGFISQSLASVRCTAPDTNIQFENVHIQGAGAQYGLHFTNNTNHINLWIDRCKIEGTTIAGIFYNNGSLNSGSVHISETELNNNNQAIVVNNVRYYEHGAEYFQNSANYVLSGTSVRITSSVDGAGGVTDHGFLTGLADDDHKQYFLISGTRGMSGALNMNGFPITSVGLVDGVDVSVLDATVDTHILDVANPHSTKFSNLVPETLASLNAAISDANVVSEATFGTFSSSVNSATASLQSATASFSSFSATLQAATASLQSATASIQGVTASYLAFSSTVNTALAATQEATASLQTFTASYLAFSSTINLTTASLQAASGSLQSATASLQTVSASYLAFSSTINSSVISLQSSTASIQSATASLQTFTASYLAFSSTINSATASLQSSTASLQSSTASIQTITASYLAVSASYDIVSSSVTFARRPILTNLNAVLNNSASLWLRPNTAISSSASGSVYYWGDQSLTNHATHSVASELPTLNSQGVFFDGTDDRLVIKDAASLDATTALVVGMRVKPATLAGSRAWITKSSSGGGTWSIQYVGELRFWTSLGTVGAAIASSNILAQEWNTILIMFSGGGSSNQEKIKFKVNGVFCSASYYGTAPTALTADANPVTIGCFSNFLQFFSGGFREIMMANFSPTEDQLTEVENYLTFGSNGYVPDHATTHLSGGKDFINAQDLAATNLGPGKFLVSNLSGGWESIATSSFAPNFYVNFHNDAGSDVTLSSMPAAADYFAGSSRHLKRIDLTNFNYVKFEMIKAGTTGAANSTASLRFTEVTGSIPTVGHLTNSVTTTAQSAYVHLNFTNNVTGTEWLPLTSSVKKEGFLGIITQGGDGVVSPVVASIWAVFKK